MDVGATSKARAEGRGRRRALVVGARLALIMLAIAAAALLALGGAVLLAGDAPEPSGWLRAAFGTVFGTMAIALAAILGIPAAVGVWAMSGATEADASPALSRNVQRIAAGLALAALAATATCVLALGSGVTFLDLALVGTVAMPTLGLAGAVRFSPHRGRARVAAIALLVLCIGTTWVLYRAYVVVAR